MPHILQLLAEWKKGAHGPREKVTKSESRFKRVTKQKTLTWQFFVTFLGLLSDPFQWLSDLQLGNERVTLNHPGSDFLVIVEMISSPFP